MELSSTASTLPIKFPSLDLTVFCATLLAQLMNETEIAHELKVDQSTISRDKVLKELSNNYVLLLVFDSL
jgi:predicted transcriptional regulator